ncbi:uncharacterized protein BDZ99DRAFT_457105 [Mytilinidion resinicola]|uniref:Homeobox domain-containing protein n=1 Tax=Mytilinidion resinicola TaxID=574789 RepID=A0A6A6ZAX4_9PEZI|nr:uncharacterized protein BDZ99DRAFT_457105 [Mytilinidion resinicola]KAF2817367.1 hypothetical protein BDZ99DRAFT_457105 [Mytilinidion resinicola]
MSDSSSPPSSASNCDRRSSPSSGGLAFLVHSPNTVQNNLPPDVDNKPLARQKRRRTSKEDEDILKAEYQRNPKPDKATRLDIVRRVALGEKEVQIWFQNKRQNDRRRSQPAQTYDLYSSSGPSSDGPHPATMSPSLQVAVDRDDDAQEHDIEEKDSPQTASEPANLPPPTTTTTSSAGLDTSLEPSQTQQTLDAETQSTDATHVQSTDPQSYDTAPTELPCSQPLPSSQESAQGLRPGYLANRRNASFIKSQETDLLGPIPTNAVSDKPQNSTRGLKRTHSYVRLSMTVDGKARVVTDADESPSPPKSRQLPPAVFEGRSAGLRRSYSATGLHDRFAEASAQGPPSKFARTSIGRSRDSRAWEFWCDADARSSLTEKADQEGSGSAADAISLIRANSRGALRSNPNRTNTPLLSRENSKRAKQDGKVAKKGLVRASTTYGRLQSRSNEPGLAKSEEKGEDNENDFEIPQTESDKENWEPEDPAPNSGRAKGSQSQPAFQRRSRQILGENTEILSQCSSLGVMMDREKRLKANRKSKGAEGENVCPDDDEEVASFMGSKGASSVRSVSSGEELGCVEGLLALANWR